LESPVPIEDMQNSGSSCSSSYSAELSIVDGESIPGDDSFASVDIAEENASVSFCTPPVDDEENDIHLDPHHGLSVSESKTAPTPSPEQSRSPDINSNILENSFTSVYGDNISDFKQDLLVNFDYIEDVDPCGFSKDISTQTILDDAKFGFQDLLSNFDYIEEAEKNMPSHSQEVNEKLGRFEKHDDYLREFDVVENALPLRPILLVDAEVIESQMHGIQYGHLAQEVLGLGFNHEMINLHHGSQAIEKTDSLSHNCNLLREFEYIEEVWVANDPPFQIAEYTTQPVALNHVDYKLNDQESNTTKIVTITKSKLDLLKSFDFKEDVISAKNEMSGLSGYDYVEICDKIAAKENHDLNKFDSRESIQETAFHVHSNLDAFDYVEACCSVVQEVKLNLDMYDYIEACIDVVPEGCHNMQKDTFHSNNFKVPESEPTTKYISDGIRPDTADNDTEIASTNTESIHNSTTTEVDYLPLGDKNSISKSKQSSNESYTSEILGTAVAEGKSKRGVLVHISNMDAIVDALCNSILDDVQEKLIDG